MSTHPNELELLALVEGEPADERLRTHVAACPACSAAVAEVERARRALRAAPLLELPEARLREALASLPAAGRRRPLVRPRRLAVALAPVAAVAAVVAVLTTGGGGGRPAPPAVVQARPAQAEGVQDRAGGALSAPVTIRRVQGSAQAVAALLRARGFRARVVAGAVEVAGADPAVVERALSGRPSGPVAVVAR